MATADSEGSNLTTCPICLDLYDNPKSLPCHHALCLKCAERLYKDNSPGDTVSCPTCREKFQIPRKGVAGLKHHFYAQQMVDQELEWRESSCDKHKNEQVKFYCHDCDENICMMCVSGEHKGHKRGKIPKVADDFKLKIDYDNKQTQLAIGSVREKLKETQQNANKFLEKVENVKDKVIATGDVVRHSVDRQINDVLMKLESVSSESGTQSESVQETYEQAIACMESFQTYSRELLDKGRAITITRAGCELHDRATALLDNDVTAVKYRPPHVTFTPADVTQVKRINLIGKLTVTIEEHTDPSLSSGQCVESEQDKDGQPRKQATDRVSVLQEELIQAADRERQLQSKLEELQEKFDDFRQRSEPLWEQEMTRRQMGHVIHTLPEGEPVLGVTSFESCLYLLRGNKSSEQIEVYDTDRYSLLECLSVPGLGDSRDIIACMHNRCTYISDVSHESVHRVALPDATVTQWSVDDEPGRFSLTYTHGVLLSCPAAAKIKEFSTDGQLLYELSLGQDVVNPWHSIQLSSGQFVVCHGDRNDPSHRVCLVDSEDGSVDDSFGGARGTGSEKINVPAHMAVDRNKFVFVVSQNDCRVVLLSPVLSYVRDVVTREQLKWSPRRVHLDSDAERLYIADVQWKDGRWSAGRVVVIGV